MAAKKRDRWPELCESVIHDDGLPTRVVGDWTEEKLFTWNRYIEIVSTAMGSNPKWGGGIAYVDLFGGPGICLRETGKRIPGSPLLAALAPKPFRKILVCEKDRTLAEACERRLIDVEAGGRAEVIVGDCNAVIDDLASRIPDRALTLAFIDPEGLHLHFETLQVLTHNRRVDLAVLFADRMDIVRNVSLYAAQEHSNLDRWLGPSIDWRKLWTNLPNQDAEHTCKLFGDLFRDQLKRHLGYKYFHDHVYRSARSSLYRIIYASKHELGQRFYREISHIDRGGQMGFRFSD